MFLYAILYFVVYDPFAGTSAVSENIRGLFGRHAGGTGLLLILILILGYLRNKGTATEYSEPKYSVAPLHGWWVPQ